MRKGQIISQVFIFALAALIFGFILIIGYRAIRGVGERSELAALTKFDSEFDARVESIKLSFGSVRKETLPPLPNKYRTLCMLPSRLEDMPEQGRTKFQNSRYRQFYNDWAASAGSDEPLNLLLDPVPGIGHRGTADLVIDHPDGYCCLALEGSLVLRLEGLGNRAKAGPWSPEVTPCSN